MNRYNDDFLFRLIIGNHHRPHRTLIKETFDSDSSVFSRIPVDLVGIIGNRPWIVNRDRAKFKSQLEMCRI